jgi:predicted  nucleic acid-binding Zn-ribbon protein
MADLMRAMLNLYDIDRKIVRGKGRIREVAKSVQIQEKNIEMAREKARAVEKDLKDKAFSTDRLNMDMRAAEAEVGEQERKLKSIKNQKEYRIVTDRIKELKIKVDENESAVLAGMEEIERLQERMKACHDVVGEEELKLVSIKQGAQEEAEKIKASHAELVRRRKDAVRAVEERDGTAYLAYDHALKRTKGDPLAEMTMDGICRSCFRRQNSNVMNIVHIGKDVKNCRCQGCGRILYIKEAEAAGEAAP